MEIIIRKESSLDDFLKQYKLNSKTIYKLKNDNLIKINGEIIKTNANPLMHVEDELTITEKGHVEKIKGDKINIVYENDYVVICDKPHNMLVHSDGNTNKTLINYLGYQINCETLKVIHRIDYETRGLVMFSKNILAHTFLNYQMQNNQIKKEYLCYVQGKMKLSKNYIKIENYIGKNRHYNNKYMVLENKEPNAITFYKPIKHVNINDEECTKVLIEIVTGKTHQIRVHMSHLNHAIVNDKIYNKTSNGDLKLYNVGLTFIDPSTFENKEVKLWIE